MNAPQLQQLSPEMCYHSLVIFDGKPLPASRELPPQKPDSEINIAIRGSRPELPPLEEAGAKLPSPPASPEVKTMSPEPASINALLREHCRTRLYVHPILWKPIQLQVLGCQFVRQKLQSNRRRDRAGEKEEDSPQTTSKRRERRLKKRSRIVCHLREPTVETSKKADIDELLETYDIDKSRFKPELPFCIGKRVVAEIPTSAVFSRDSADFLAYLHLDTIKSLRRRHISGRPGKRQSEPMTSLHEIKLHAVQPPNEAEDPYIAAILIALAQEQCRQSEETASETSADSRPQSFASGKTMAPMQTATPHEVCVLVVPSARPNFVYTYRATISSAFLDKLETPSRFVPSDPIRISYSKLPLRNSTRFLKNLPRALPLSRAKRPSAKGILNHAGENRANAAPDATETVIEWDKQD